MGERVFVFWDDGRNGWAVSAIEVVKRTAKQVRVKSSWETQFRRVLDLTQVYDSWEQAHQALLADRRGHLQYYQKQLDKAQAALNQVESLRPPSKDGRGAG
jgi:hypothetical protein